MSSKSVYYYDFWRSCDTEDWNNDAGNTAAHHRNKLHLTIYSNRKQFLLKCYNISQYYSFCSVFLINKCSLGEQKRLLREHSAKHLLLGFRKNNVWESQEGSYIFILNSCLYVLPNLSFFLKSRMYGSSKRPCIIIIFLSCFLVITT